MNYAIANKLPGRIRLNCGRFAFSEKTSISMLSILKNQKGVIKATVSHVTGSIVIFYEENEIDNILSFISRTSISDLEKNEIRVVNSNQDEAFVIGIAKKIIFRFAVRPFLPMPIKTALTVINAAGYVKKALVQLFIKKRVGVEVLDAAAVTVSLIQNSQSTASSIMFLLSISEMIEKWTEDKSKANLAQSLAINIDKVWIEKDDSEILINAFDVAVGDIVVVRTGGLIPVDGTIVKGCAMVNQSGMTGEPLAIKRDFGKTVFAGTSVEEGSIYIEVSAVHNDTRINRIIKMIDESENYKSTWQSKNERIADAIVPFSFLGAIGIYLATRSFTKAASVLFVDYSCAIKLSTSLSVLSALHETAEHGVAIKGGKFLEAIAEADTIVFDKTGTLTEARPVVSEIIPLAGYKRDEVLKISACLEEHFPHSVAKAIVRQAFDEGIDHQEEHADVEYIIAHGIASKINNRRVLIGSQHFIFEDEKVTVNDDDKKIMDSIDSNDSALYLAIDGVLVGIILVNDPIKKEAKVLIEKLRTVGFKNIIMLTGDSQRNAQSVARELGIDRFKAQMLPEDKARYIDELRRNSHKVIMIGDGVNDTPALSAANVGISMQDGSDIARDVADVALFTNDLNEIVATRLISLGVIKKINQNYNFVIAFNTVLLLLGLNQIITPAVSSTLHNMSTIGLGIKSLKNVMK